MKAKLKSTGKFAGFMLAHGEKLGMGAVLVVAGLLIWSSLGRDQLGADKAPEKLQEAANSATTHVQGMNWDEFPPEEQTKAKEIIVSVNPDALVVNPDDPWEIDRMDEPPINPASKRSDPELLTVEKVEVSPGSGIWASADPRVLRERRLKAMKEEQEEARKAAEEAERLAAEAEGRGRGERDGRGRGEFGGGGDGTTTKDGAMVIRPMGGAPLQGDEDLQNHSWVIVKAKVPIRSQWKVYEKALATARGYTPTTDIPVYKGYQVQRAEVTDAGDGEWVNLINVVPKTLIRQMETWPIQTPDEFVSPRYNHPLLTFPLPPMVLRAWDASVTHSDLPLPPPDEMLGGEADGRGAPAADADEGKGSGDEFQDATQRPAGPGGFAPGRMGEFGGRGGPGFGGGFGGRGGGTDGGGRGFGGGFGMRGGDGGGRGVGAEMMGRGGGGYDTASFETYSWDGQTRFLLFRYFDSQVQPGKRYKYRVRMVLQDVNAAPSPTNPAGIQEMYLENEVIERRAKENVSYRFTPWSEPSPVAVVPQAGLVFVAGAKPANPSNFGDEPEAEMLIKSLDARSAAEVALAEYFTRGTVLNLLGQHAKIIWSETFQATDREGLPVESPEYNFQSGLTLLDFIGGEPLNGNRDLTAPARAMVMDAAGRMWIKGELDDAIPVNEYDAYVTAAAEQARQNVERQRDGGGRGGRGEGGRGGGGRGGGRGGR